MTTKRLYYDDAFARAFTAEVLSCEPGTAAAPPTPATAPAAALCRVKLARTAFYPTSGRQPNATGRLGDARVVDVLNEDHERTRFADKQIESGSVKGSIDW